MPEICLLWNFSKLFSISQNSSENSQNKFKKNFHIEGTFLRRMNFAKLSNVAFCRIYLEFFVFLWPIINTKLLKQLSVSRLLQQITLPDVKKITKYKKAAQEIFVKTKERQYGSRCLLLNEYHWKLHVGFSRKRN